MWRAAIAHLVCQTQPPARLLGLGPQLAGLAMGDGTLATIAVIESRRVPGPALGEHLRKLAEDNPHAHLKHIVVGGDPSAVRKLLRGVQPKLSMRRAIQVFALDDEGQLWVGPGSRRDSLTGKALLAAASNPDPPTADALQALVRPPPPLSPAQHEFTDEGERFLSRLRSHKPRAVWGLLAAIAVVFALEVAFGGSEFTPTLVRMGANTEASLHGEPWRLAASVLLHAGPTHAVINGVVLIVLGGFLERIVGAARTIVLLVASGIGGSVASALAGAAALSVGASGAIWGALGAAAVLGLRPSAVIPAAVLPSLRRAAIINLGINLTASFLPQVDLWAHLGGGFVGAALVGTGLLTRGLPGTGGTTMGQRPTATRPMTAAAIASTVTLVGGLGVALAMGRPWVLVRDVTPQTHALGDTGLQLQLPDYFDPVRHETDGDVETFSVGDLLRDPFALDIAFQSGPTNDASRRAELDAVSTEPPPSGATLVEPWHRSAVGTDALESTVAFDNGLVLRMWYQVRREHRLRVDITSWSEGPGAPARALALRSIAQ